MPAMLKADVVKHFGSAAAAAKAIGLHRTAPSFWHEYVPPRQALKFHKVTKGKLRFDATIYTAETDKA